MNGITRSHTAASGAVRDSSAALPPHCICLPRRVPDLKQTKAMHDRTSSATAQRHSG